MEFKLVKENSVNGSYANVSKNGRQLGVFELDNWLIRTSYSVVAACQMFLLEPIVSGCFLNFHRLRLFLTYGLVCR